MTRESALLLLGFTNPPEKLSALARYGQIFTARFIDQPIES